MITPVRATRCSLPRAVAGRHGTSFMPTASGVQGLKLHLTFSQPIPLISYQLNGLADYLQRRKIPTSGTV